MPNLFASLWKAVIGLVTGMPRHQVEIEEIEAGVCVSSCSCGWQAKGSDHPMAKDLWQDHIGGPNGIRIGPRREGE